MTKSFFLFPTLIALSAGSQAAAPAADAGQGKKVHATYCTSCHTDSVYTRKDRQITNMKDLAQKVNACSHQIEVSLSKEQVGNLAKYLNETYYKFK